MAITPEGYALLNTIAGPESAGSYNVMYSPTRTLRRFTDYSDHPRNPATISSGKNKGLRSDAAGKYQFRSETWDRAARALGLTDFSPESQDEAAWWLAQHDYGRRTGGRDLQADLATGDPERLAYVSRKLSPTWTSLPSGIEATTNTNRFVRIFNQNLAADNSALDAINEASPRNGGTTALGYADAGGAAAPSYPTQAQLASMPDGRFNPKPMAEQFGNSMQELGRRSDLDSQYRMFNPATFSDGKWPNANNTEQFRVPPDPRNFQTAEAQMAGLPPAPPPMPFDRIPDYMRQQPVDHRGQITAENSMARLPPNPTSQGPRIGGQETLAARLSDRLINGFNPPNRQPGGWATDQGMMLPLDRRNQMAAENGMGPLPARDLIGPPVAPPNLFDQGPRFNEFGGTAQAAIPPQIPTPDPSGQNWVTLPSDTLAGNSAMSDDGFARMSQQAQAVNEAARMSTPGDGIGTGTSWLELQDFAGVDPINRDAVPPPPQLPQATQDPFGYMFNTAAAQPAPEVPFDLLSGGTEWPGYSTTPQAPAPVGDPLSHITPDGTPGGAVTAPQWQPVVEPPEFQTAQQQQPQSSSGNPVSDAIGAFSRMLFDMQQQGGGGGGLLGLLGGGGGGAGASGFPYQQSRNYGLIGGRHPYRKVGGMGGHSGGGFG